MKRVGGQFRGGSGTLRPLPATAQRQGSSPVPSSRLRLQQENLALVPAAQKRKPPGAGPVPIFHAGVRHRRPPNKTAAARRAWFSLREVSSLTRCSISWRVWQKPCPPGGKNRGRSYRRPDCPKMHRRPDRQEHAEMLGPPFHGKARKIPAGAGHMHSPRRWRFGRAQPPGGQEIAQILGEGTAGQPRQKRLDDLRRAVPPPVDAAARRTPRIADEYRFWRSNSQSEYPLKPRRIKASARRR